MPIVLLATGFGLDQNPDRLDTFLAHRGALVSYATRIVGERADAEDVVQDAYLRFEAAEPEREGMPWDLTKVTRPGAPHDLFPERSI